MPIRRLQREEWGDYFASYSAGLARRVRPEKAEIRVFSIDIGNQVAARWLPLHGITYDSRSDVVEVDVDGLGHMIYGPRAIWVDEEMGGLLRVDVKRSDGTEEIIELR